MDLVLWDKDFDYYCKGEVDLDILEVVQHELNIVLPISYV